MSSSYARLLAAYPYPAWELVRRDGARKLAPVFANAALRALLLGPAAGTAADLDDDELSAPAFAAALGPLAQARAFTDWALVSDAPEATMEVELVLAWTDARARLELVRTQVDGRIVITSVPRAPLPVPVPLPSPAERAPSPAPPPPAPSPAPLQSCLELYEAHDWAATPLGPRARWPAELRACVHYALANPFPMCVWWGPALVLVYNDGYAAAVAGAAHPAAFGKAGAVAWGEMWGMVGPASAKVMAGETVSRVEDLLFFHRLTAKHLPEETYHNWSCVPVRDAVGVVNGSVNSASDVTAKVVSDRRLALLRDLNACAATARTQNQLARAIVEVFERSPLEAPFAAIWSCNAHDNTRVRLELAGTVGVPADGTHPAFPSALDLDLAATDAAPTLSPMPPSTGSLPDVPARDERSPGAFRDSANRSASRSSRSPYSAHSSDAEPALGLAAAAFWPFVRAYQQPDAALLVEDLPSWVTTRVEPRAWGDIPREAVVIPLLASDDDRAPHGVGALLVLALNSRRPYDAAYAGFVDLLRLVLNALLTAVVGREADGARARQLAQLDEAKTAFFGSVSHEFRTPLTLIQGPLEDCLGMLPRAGAAGEGDVESAEGAPLDSKRQRAVRKRVAMALRNVARLRRLVDSLMDFSKLAANRLVGRFRPVALGPYTADLASLFRAIIEREGITYEVTCGSVGNDSVYVDPDFWEKIICNLIGNAYKYTMSGTITVSMELRDGCVHVSVRDTGVGIPPGDIDKVFDRFHRVDTVGRSHEGTGIGLALTKELVILHGGRITLSSLTADDSPDNHGSTFTVALPLGSAHLPAAHVDTTPMASGEDPGAHRMYGRGIVEEAKRWALSERPVGAPSSSGTAETESSDSNRMDPSTLFFVKSDRVLLVDDNADMRQYMSGLLRPYCTVLEAANGQDALDLLEALRTEEEDALAAGTGGPADSSRDLLRQRRMPDLIISDIMMPVLDGLGLVTRLRQRAETRLLPIILVTAKESEEARVEGLLGGADDYLCKPFTARELIARVHLHLQLGKRRAELEALFNARTHELKVLSDLSPVGIIRASTGGRTTYVNARWCEISGADGAPGADGDAWIARVVGDGAARVREAWEGALIGRRSTSVELMFDNGRYAKGQFEPIVSEQGTFNGVIGTLTDLSETRKHEAEKLAHAEERAATARQQAEDADVRRRGQELLIDVTSHELRQPVSAILNCSSLVRGNLATLYAELARDGVYTPNAAALQRMRDDLDALDAIYQCGLAQERIANDVLSLSRIQLEVLSIESVDFALVSELRRIVAIFSNEVKMKRIRLDVRLDPSVAALGVRNVRTDRARFGQIVTNLLSNAIKFTDTSTEARDIVATLSASRRAPPADAPCVPPEGPEAPLDASELPAEIYLYCAVKDSGPGLRPDDLALLFRRFQQGSNSHNVFGGSGLGLFVSRKLCELMHGHIDVASVYGQGATFRFYIRAQAVAGELISSLSSPPVVSAPVPTQNSKLHVLIAEDNLINQTVLNRQLTAQGFATTLANNGQQALKHVRARAENNSRFDVVLMDCEMPVMDGLSAVREIRRLEATGALPGLPTVVFALTGNARAEQVQSARDAGMDDVVIKPYKLESLVGMINTAASRRRGTLPPVSEANTADMQP